MVGLSGEDVCLLGVAGRQLIAVKRTAEAGEYMTRYAGAEELRVTVADSFPDSHPDPRDPRRRLANNLREWTFSGDDMTVKVGIRRGVTASALGVDVDLGERYVDVAASCQALAQLIGGR